MNIGSEQRFHELVHKALANQAQAAELKELRALIAENPQLKDELDQMRADVAIAREFLPLLEDIQHPPNGIPAPPRERLQKEVRNVFESAPQWKGEVQILLRKLENWAGRVIGTEREQVLAVIEAVRRSMRAPEEEHAMAAAALHETSGLSPEDSASMESKPTDYRLSQERWPAGLQARLLNLEKRIEEADQSLSQCRHEVRVLLDLLAREKKSK